MQQTFSESKTKIDKRKCRRNHRNAAMYFKNKGGSILFLVSKWHLKYARNYKR